MILLVYANCVLLFDVGILMGYFVFGYVLRWEKEILLVFLSELFIYCIVL